ncbi:antifreeze protein [Paenochrobactrum sp. BZR 588]|uniref:antifreeze protein n=1 Tax=unclassified Paenochrobactrum TaxID=2639760 RepID=UPI003853671D
MKPYALPFLILFSLSALTACGKDDAEAPQQEPAAVQPAETVPAVQEPEAPVDAPDLLETLKENSGVLTPEQEAEIVARARKNAESAAKSVGQNDEQIKAAGDRAEASAKQFLAAKKTPVQQ